MQSSGVNINSFIGVVAVVLAEFRGFKLVVG